MYVRGSCRSGIAPDNFDLMVFAAEILEFDNGVDRIRTTKLDGGFIIGYAVDFGRGEIDACGGGGGGRVNRYTNTNEGGGQEPPPWCGK